MKADGLFSHPGVPINSEGVMKHYRSGPEQITAVNGISLQVQPKVPVALVGVSGCGKTTLLNLVGGVDRADSGTILVNGVDLCGLEERALEEYRLNRVGFIFQSYNLIPSLTAVENVELPMTMAGKLQPHEARHRALSLLAVVSMENKANKRPDELSGGEQQRVAIGVALSNDPPIILADEPTANLDQKNLEVVSGLLLELAHSYHKTLLIATHDPRVSSQLDVIVKMEEGRLLDTGKNATGETKQD